jgi:hypothetical protein
MVNPTDDIEIAPDPGRLRLDLNWEIPADQDFERAPCQRVTFFQRLVGVADRSEPDRPPLGLDDLLGQERRCVDLDIDEIAPRLAVAAISPHEQRRVTINAADFATGVRIDAVIVDLRGIEDGLGFDLADDRRGHRSIITKRDSPPCGDSPC